MERNEPNVLENSLDQSPKTGHRYEKILDDIEWSIAQAFAGEIFNKQVDEHLSIKERLIYNDPEKVHTHLDRLFMLADFAKERMDYETANKLWGVLYDYALTDPDAPISFEYEYSDTDPDKATSERYEDNREISNANYHGLAVLRYNNHYLNIPAPLLSADALNMFLRFAKPVDRHQHNRQHALNPYLGFDHIKQKIAIEPVEWMFDDEFFNELIKEEQKQEVEENYYDHLMNSYLEQEQEEKVSR